MSSNDNKQPCCYLTPDDDCSKTCCPDYQPDSDWCKAFNKRTLEQLKEVTDLSIDGMWFNIEDMKNVIAQTEQYLAMIYELLIACHDQVMKASSTAGRTTGDFESASTNIKEYVKEIRLIVGGAQYNGRYLLQDTVKTVRGIHDAGFDADGHAAYGAAGFTIAAQVHGTDIASGGVTITLAAAVTVSEGDFVYRDNGTFLGKIDLVTDGTNFNLDTALTDPLPQDTNLEITPAELTDKIIYGDTVERKSITSRLKGPRGFCRNVSSVFNDFVFVLPHTGIHSLGLTSFTSSGGQDYYVNGIDNWTESEGLDAGDTTLSEDQVDETIKDFNCAIKIIGVELDKMRSYRYLCCLREKQVRIYKEGQKKCMEHKMKI